MEKFTLPGYQVLEKIGEGGTATVWKARHLALDRTVAIKVMAKGSLPDQEALSRFRAESQAAAKLNHPGIVHVYDAGEQEGIAFYVMEFVDGYSVGDLLSRKGKIDENDALIIAESVALALDYAWQKAGIIHCDIKPDNVMIDKDGAIKVADLGLARIFERRLSDREDVIWGTPNYVSPEQAEGRVDLDCRSDVYSLGAMLFHLVTGELPFAKSPGSSAMDKHISDYLQDPQKINPALPAGTAWLLEKMMIKNRSQRPEWKEVLADLSEVRRGGMPNHPLPEPGASTILRSEKRSRAPLPKASAVKKIIISKKEIEQLSSAKDRANYDVGRAVRTLFFLIVITAACYGAILARTGKKQAPEPHQPQPESPPPITAAAQPEPTPHQPNEPNRLRSAAPKPSTWQHPDFIKAADLYNSALRGYKSFLENRQLRATLPSLEQQCHEAVRLFETCKNSAPADVPLDHYISECNRLMFDIRQSIHMGSQDPRRRRN